MMSLSESSDIEIEQRQKSSPSWMTTKLPEQVDKKQQKLGMTNHFDQNANKQTYSIEAVESESDMDYTSAEYKNLIIKKVDSASSKPILSMKSQSKIPAKINSTSFGATYSMDDQHEEQMTEENLVNSEVHDQESSNVVENIEDKSQKPEMHDPEPSNVVENMEDESQKLESAIKPEIRFAGKKKNEIDLNKQLIDSNMHYKIFHSAVVSLVLSTGSTKISIEELIQQYKLSIGADFGDALKLAGYNDVFEINNESERSLHVKREDNNDVIFEVTLMDDVNVFLFDELLYVNGKGSRSKVNEQKRMEFLSKPRIHKASTKSISNLPKVVDNPLKFTKTQTGILKMQEISSESESEKSTSSSNIKKPIDGTSTSTSHIKKPFNLQPSSVQNANEEKSNVPNSWSQKSWSQKPSSFNQEEKSTTASSGLPKKSWSSKQSVIGQEEKSAAAPIKKTWSTNQKSNQEENLTVVSSDLSQKPKSDHFLLTSQPSRASVSGNKLSNQPALNEQGGKGDENPLQKKVKVVLQNALEKQSQVRLNQVRKEIEREIGELGIAKCKEIFGFQPKSFGDAINSLRQFRVKKNNGISYVVLNEDYLMTESEENDEDYLATDIE